MADTILAQAIDGSSAPLNYRAPAFNLTDQHGLATKPAFVGMSRGGEYAYIWSTTHPDKVSCIYADNTGINAEVLAKLGDLAKADVPILHVNGSIDPLLGRCSNTVENIYRQLGGRISVIIKEGMGHHPHSLRDPKPIADFISQSFLVAEVVDDGALAQVELGGDVGQAGVGVPAVGDVLGEDAQDGVA